MRIAVLALLALVLAAPPAAPEPANAGCVFAVASGSDVPPPHCAAITIANDCVGQAHATVEAAGKLGDEWVVVYEWSTWSDSYTLSETQHGATAFFEQAFIGAPNLIYTHLRVSVSVNGIPVTEASETCAWR